jgi:ABC-type multidrug transport system fused ATPase/permease subunit
VPKQKQIKMQTQVGALAAIPQLESRTDEQLMSESKHRVAAKAILGARAAERYDVQAARKYFNEALAGSHPQERPALRQMMKASLALAERKPDELKQAMERLGQDAPSGRQLFMLRMMGLLIPPASAGIVARIRGILLLIALVIVLLAVGFGVVTLIALPFGGIGTASAVFFGFLLVVIAIAVLVLLGRRRQARARASRAAGGAPR